MSMLKNVLRFVNVAVGGSQTLVHGLNINDRGLVPDEIKLSSPGFTATATDTSVTVTNVGSVPASCDALVEYWHSIERVMPVLSVSPFVASTGRMATVTNVNVSPYDIASSDYIVSVDSSVIPISIRLPSAVTHATKIVIIKDAGGSANTNNITVTSPTAGTMDGVATQTISSNYGSLTFYSDGTDWFII